MTLEEYYSYLTGLVNSKQETVISVAKTLNPTTIKLKPKLFTVKNNSNAKRRF